MCNATDAGRVPLSGGKGAGLYALVDIEDLVRVMPYRWIAHNQGYAVTSQQVGGRKHNTLLHRFILGAHTGDPDIDHRNNDKLDCRKDNLRYTNHHGNARNRGLTVNNTSGYKGVYWSHKNKRWVAQIRRGSKTQYLGIFLDPAAAARAYDAAAIKLHGGFAKTNADIRQKACIPE